MPSDETAPTATPPSGEPPKSKNGPYPPETRVVMTLTLRSGNGLRDVTGWCVYNDWRDYVHAIADNIPSIFEVTTEQGLLLGEERILDPRAVIVNVSARLVLPVPEPKAPPEPRDDAKK